MLSNRAVPGCPASVVRHEEVWRLTPDLRGLEVLTDDGEAIRFVQRVIGKFQS
jgi:hypothetical protein